MILYPYQNIHHQHIHHYKIIIIATTIVACTYDYKMTDLPDTKVLEPRAVLLHILSGYTDTPLSIMTWPTINNAEILVSVHI